MKLTRMYIDDTTTGVRSENPTLEERVNFLEHTLRRIQPHEVLCESRRPDFIAKHWWSSPSVTFLNECDCWLSEPFGTTGIEIPC